MMVGKGVGMVRISPDDETNIDVFVTHLAANQDPYNECNWLTCLWYDNSYYRKRQVKQMMNLVTKSNADIKIIAGDLNTRPKGMKQIRFNFNLQNTLVIIIMHIIQPFMYICIVN